MPSQIDLILEPHFRAALDATKRPALFDVHTHIGTNDPDGMRQSSGELIDGLDVVGSRAVVFPMHEPSGYQAANEEVRRVAEASDGRLSWLCRLDPRADALAHARHCLDAGARGIKLHPRAECFELSAPIVAELVALAHERRAMVLLHAGRGIPALGQNTIALAERFPDARLILAHAAISDLAWIWRKLEVRTNIFVDTSWWHPSDLTALFSLVPPGQILWASDSPYGSPVFAGLATLRCARQSGLDEIAIAAIMGGQTERLVAGEDPLDVGSAPAAALPIHPLLERVVAHLTGAMHRVLVDADPVEPLALARLSCDVGPDGPHASLMSDIVSLLDLYERWDDSREPVRLFPQKIMFLVAALVLARTPDAL